jgi:hypothetical protein
MYTMADPVKAMSEIDAIRQFVGAALLLGAAAARSHARATWIASGGAARYGDAAGASRII